MFCCQDSQLLILAYEKVIRRKGIWIAKRFQLVSYYFNYAMESAISLPISKVTYGKFIQRLCEDSLSVFSLRVTNPYLSTFLYLWNFLLNSVHTCILSTVLIVRLWYTWHFILSSFSRNILGDKIYCYYKA